MQPSCIGMILAIALSACLAAAVSSCDYPEAGCFAVAGYNDAGELLFFNPFMVEEITDDSSMTTGFMVLLPRDGELVEVELANGEDITRRYWLLDIAGADTGAGNLSVEISHSTGRLAVFGGYQPDPALPGYEVFTYIDPESEFDSRVAGDDVTRLLAGYAEGLVSIKIIGITLRSFENALGALVEEAPRIAATPLEPFDTIEIPADQPEEPAPDAQPEENKPPKSRKKPATPPNLGGRGGSRPR